jgi:hypothetical protein
MTLWETLQTTEVNFACIHIVVCNHNELHAREDIQAEVWDRGGAVGLGSFALGFPRGRSSRLQGKQFPDMPPTMVPTAIKR